MKRSMDVDNAEQTPASVPKQSFKRKPGDAKTTVATASDKPLEPLQAYFASLSKIYDANNDLRERLIKLSRDITRNSKAVISTLQSCAAGLRCMFNMACAFALLPMPAGELDAAIATVVASRHFTAMAEMRDRVGHLTLGRAQPAARPGPRPPAQRTK